MNFSYIKWSLLSSITLFSTSFAEERKAKKKKFDPLAWVRPTDNPIFTNDFGNNHDSVLFVEPDADYPYHLIISHTPTKAQLWRAKKFTWDSSKWELVNGEYKIGKHYEYDDGVKVGDTYYLYEAGKVYTYKGDLKDSSGQWKVTGSFPHRGCDDIGIFYENGVFHMFGEFGKFPHGADGTSLSHYTSTTGLGNWLLVDNRAVDANPEGGNTYGVGDATLAKIDGTYYLYCDRESKTTPYRVVAWKSNDINKPFTFIGEALIPRSEEKDDWDNYRIQDADLEFIPELGHFVMTCNMMDKDGQPGWPVKEGEKAKSGKRLEAESTRVIGTFYHQAK